MSGEAIVIPVHLGDFIAQVKMPDDLTRAEAERICRIVMAYAVDNITVALPDEAKPLENSGKT